MNQSKNKFLEIALERQTVIRAIKICLIVGTILNMINQGTLIFGWDWQNISISRMMLTYCVPYCVSTYSSAMAKLKG